MSEPTRPVKVYKIEVEVIDLEGIGPEQIKGIIEHARYPGRSISPTVHGMESREVQWHDGHPLNTVSTSDEAYRELFPKKEE